MPPPGHTRTSPQKPDGGLPTAPRPPPFLTVQPLLLELCSHVAHVSPLQGLARHVQGGLRPEEAGQTVSKVRDLRALQPTPRDAASILLRIPQLVAEALQLRLTQLIERVQEQTTGGCCPGLRAEGWAGGGTGSARAPQIRATVPGPRAGAATALRGSHVPPSPQVAPGQGLEALYREWTLPRPGPWSGTLLQGLASYCIAAADDLGSPQGPQWAPLTKHWGVPPCLTWHTPGQTKSNAQDEVPRGPGHSPLLPSLSWEPGAGPASAGGGPTRPRLCS